MLAMPAKSDDSLHFAPGPLLFTLSDRSTVLVGYCDTAYSDKPLLVTLERIPKPLLMIFMHLQWQICGYSDTLITKIEIERGFFQQ